MCSRNKRRRMVREVAVRESADRLLQLSTHLQFEAMRVTAGMFSYKSNSDVIEMLNNIDYELGELSGVISALYDSLEGR